MSSASYKTPNKKSAMTAEGSSVATVPWTPGRVREKTASERIMDINTKINEVLAQIPEEEKEYARLRQVLVSVKGSVDYLKAVHKQMQVEETNRKQLIAGLHEFIGKLDTLDSYIRALEKVDPNDTVEVVQTCSMVSHFLEENRNDPLVLMDAYEQRTKRIGELVNALKVDDVRRAVDTIFIKLTGSTSKQ